MDPDMALLHVSMLMTDGIYCFLMSLVLVGTLIGLFMANRSIRAERQEQNPSTFSEAIEYCTDFDFRAEACIMGLADEMQELGQAMVEEARASHIFPVLQRREFDALAVQLPYHERLAVQRAFRNQF